MSVGNQLPKRRRGIISTPQGWQRLQAAKRHSEIRENSGNLYTLEDLRDRTNLSLNTLTKIQHRQVVVDRQSLECYFSAFNLTLNSSDYSKFNPENVEIRHKVTLKGQVPLDSPFYVEIFIPGVIKAR